MGTTESLLMFANRGKTVLLRALAIGASTVSIAACSLITGDIKESNELGEWVVAKPQTFRYKAYVPAKAETVSGLQELMTDKIDAREKCLAHPVKWETDLLGNQVEQKRDCTWEGLKADNWFYYVTDNDWTAEETKARLEMAKRLWNDISDKKLVAKGVVWRGLKKEVGKQEMAIKDREDWCLNPSIKESDQRDWKVLLERLLGSQEVTSNPDAKMYERLQKRICEAAWKN